MVIIRNPLEGTKSISFREELVGLLGTETVRRDAGEVAESFTPENSTTSFQLLHTDTGAILGTATYQDLYVMLSSLYLALAEKRDASA